MANQREPEANCVQQKTLEQLEQPGTRKLYYEDSHRKSCTAMVRACQATEQGYDVIVDQTVLFPTGGGQQTDLGAMGPAKVLACREEGDEVIHLVDAPLTPGETVTITLDWERRFDYMQQHTGEHLLSFGAYHLFGAANVGFHLADSYTTIDFDKPLTKEQLTQMEDLANRFVWENLPVEARVYPDEDAIAELPLRKHAEGLKAPIRIVSIEGADCCTCCAPHCRRTGEVGLIFIIDAAAYKGGTRVTFLCGKRAVASLRGEHEALDRLARRFSTSRELTESAVIKRCDEYSALKRQERSLIAQLNGYVTAQLAASAETVGKWKLVTALLDDIDGGRLKDLAQGVAKPGVLAALFAKSQEKLLYVIACGEGFPVDAGELAQAVNAAINGKGGGRGTLAQGMSATLSGAEQAVEQVHDYLTRRLR